MKIFPFSGGAVIVINMLRGTAHNMVLNNDSNCVGEALRKTKLFSEDKIKPLANKGVDHTMYGIISTTQYLLFKNSSDKSWNETSAKDDVENIITKVKEKYGKH